MSAPDVNYHPRYLAGVLLFNDGDFFEAHEVWEDLWAESYDLERKFYQGLIQAAVGLCHFGNGNLGGAVKLFHTSKAYMGPCGSPFLGLDVTDFWRQMERCYSGILGQQSPDRSLRPAPESYPVIRLSPEPASWPDPTEFLHDEE